MTHHRLPRSRRRGSARLHIMQIELACGMPQAGGGASAHTSCARASTTAGRTQALCASLEPHWLGVCECALVCATRCCVSLGTRCGVHPAHTHVLEAHMAGRYDCEVECGGATCEAKRRWRSVRGRRGRCGASLRANTTKLARPCAEARAAARTRACARARVCVCACARRCLGLAARAPAWPMPTTPGTHACTEDTTVACIRVARAYACDSTRHTHNGRRNNPTPAPNPNRGTLCPRPQLRLAMLSAT